MRRVTMLLAAMAVMVMLLAVAAYAAEIEGTKLPDKVFESDRNDTIFGRNGEDQIDARAFSMQVILLGDKDDLRGNKHDDTLWADDGDTRDEVDGGMGTDRCYIDDLGPGNTDEWEDCEFVNDVRIPQ